MRAVDEPITLMHEAYNEMSKAVWGEEATGGPQKAKALWMMKAAMEAGEEYNDPTRVDNILGRNKTRLALWEQHLTKIQLLRWTKP